MEKKLIYPNLVQLPHPVHSLRLRSINARKPHIPLTQHNKTCHLSVVAQLAVDSTCAEREIYWQIRFKKPDDGHAYRYEKAIRAGGHA